MPDEGPESAKSPAKAPSPTPPGPSVRHRAQFQFLDELKHRNVVRLGVLYVIVCWLILEPVHVIFHMLEAPAWANRIVIILMALGFPAVLLFAWVYEITPEGMKPTVQVPHGQSIRRQTGQRLNRAIIVTLSVALAYFVVDKFWLSKHVAVKQPAEVMASFAPATTSAASAISDKSIAVLPFVDLSEKKDQEYFADGMAEEVIDLLAKLPGMRVIGRTSSFQFKGRMDDLRKIGSALGAAYVVEGSVRKAGDRLRVTAQLIGTHDGSHLWSETYDDDVGDVLKVQDRIATGLVRALQVTIGADDLKAPTTIKNAEAYDLYLRGRHAFDRYTKPSVESALAYFQQALELDPSFIRAAEWLAVTHLWRADSHEGYEQARASVKQGLALDPKSGALHSLMALIAGPHDWDWSAAEQEARRALALSPRDAAVLDNVGGVYGCLGRWDEAQRLYTASLAVDPPSIDAHLGLGVALIRTGRFSEAEDEFRKILEISPTAVLAHSNLGWTLMYEGKLTDALAEMQREPTDLRNWGPILVYYRMGHKAESDAALAKYTNEHSADDPYGIADAHAYRGEVDQAFAWLDRAYNQGQGWLYYVKGNPDFKSIQSDPRYKAFLRKMKLPE